MNQLVNRLAWALTAAPLAFHTVYEVSGKRLAPGVPELMLDGLVIASVLVGVVLLVSHRGQETAVRSRG